MSWGQEVDKEQIYCNILTTLSQEINVLINVLISFAHNMLHFC